MHIIKKTQRGFTLIEAIISLVMFVALVIAAYMFYIKLSESTVRNARKIQTSERARAAMELLTRDIAMMGFGVDSSAIPEQPKICWAGPFQLVFNADLESVSSEELDALDPEETPSQVPPGVPVVLYAPVHMYATSAETIRYSLDATGDGIIDINDHENVFWEEESQPENRTQNPGTYILFREVYGYNETSVPLNHGQKEPVVFGLKGWGGTADNYPSGEYPAPLFQYWGDFDADPEEDLWGDTNGDGELSTAECTAWFNPPENIAQREVTYSETTTDTNGNGVIDSRLEEVLTRIVVTVTAEDNVRDVKYPNLVRSDTNHNKRIDPGESPYYFHDVVISTTIYPRNLKF